VNDEQPGRESDDNGPQAGNRPACNSTRRDARRAQSTSRSAGELLVGARSRHFRGRFPAAASRPSAPRRWVDRRPGRACPFSLVVLKDVKVPSRMPAPHHVLRSPSLPLSLIYHHFPHGGVFPCRCKPGSRFERSPITERNRADSPPGTTPFLTVGTWGVCDPCLWLSRRCWGSPPHGRFAQEYLRAAYRSFGPEETNRPDSLGNLSCVSQPIFLQPLRPRATASTAGPMAASLLRPG